MKKRGFTIVELIIVVVVIAILATIVIVGYGAVRRSAIEATMKSDLQTAITALEAAWLRNSPISGDDLQSSGNNKLNYTELGESYCVDVINAQTPTTFSYSTATKVIKNGACSFKSTNVAGSGTGASVDGTGSAASFYGPRGVSLSPDEKTLYVVDSTGNQLRAIDVATRQVSTLVASGAGLSSPYGVTASQNGDIFIADCNGQRIRKLTSGGVMSTYAGTGVYGSTDGVATSSKVWCPSAIAIDSQGTLYFTAFGSNNVRKITPDGQLSTYAGTGVAGYADGALSTAQFSSPRGIALDKAGNVYVAESNSGSIRKIGTDGIVSTIVGNGTAGQDVQGTGAQARLNGPVGLAISGDNLYIGTASGLRAYNIKTDTVTKPSLTGDTGNMSFIWGVAVSKQGVVYMSSYTSNLLWTVVLD